MTSKEEGNGKKEERRGKQMDKSEKGNDKKQEEGNMMHKREKEMARGGRRRPKCVPFLALDMHAG